MNNVDISLVFLAYKKVCNKYKIITIWFIENRTNQKITYSQFSQAVGCEDNYLSKFIFERYSINIMI